MSRSVVLNFSTDEEADRFLDYVLSLDDHARYLVVADMQPTGKAKLTKYRVKAIHVREET